MSQLKSAPTRGPFIVRPHDTEGTWASDDERHFEDAIGLLRELEEAATQVIQSWPLPVDQPVRNAKQNYPELWSLIRKRDRLSDSVRIFSAMAVEGFLNYYGVLRLGEAEYNAQFERLGAVLKLRALLLVCDSISLTKDDPLIRLLQQITEGRNSLVHPKAKEYRNAAASPESAWTPVPGAARDAVTNMQAFFKEFVAAVPNAKYLVPPIDSERNGQVP